MPVNIPVHATQLEESILRQVRSAGRKIGSKGGINLGTSAKSIEALSQPLGRITGKADQFTKSMMLQEEQSSLSIQLPPPH